MVLRQILALQCWMSKNGNISSELLCFSCAWCWKLLFMAEEAQYLIWKQNKWRLYDCFDFFVMTISVLTDMHHLLQTSVKNSTFISVVMTVELQVPQALSRSVKPLLLEDIHVFGDELLCDKKYWAKICYTWKDLFNSCMEVSSAGWRWHEWVPVRNWKVGGGEGVSAKAGEQYASNGLKCRGIFDTNGEEAKRSISFLVEPLPKMKRGKGKM